MTTNRVIGPQSNPQLADLVNKVKLDINYNFNAVQLGTIQSYNNTKNTAQVSINFKRLLPTGDVKEYPVLVDCPVFILSGGDCNISMPITQGDQCIILFNDRDIDNWFYSGAVDVPATGRAHSISDALILVGVRNLTTASPTSTTTVRIDAGSKKVAIKNDAQNMKVLIDLLIDTIINITVGNGNIPLNPTSIAALTAVKTQWALLLDQGLT